MKVAWHDSPIDGHDAALGSDAMDYLDYVYEIRVGLGVQVSIYACLVAETEHKHPCLTMLRMCDSPWVAWLLRRFGMLFRYICSVMSGCGRI